MGDFYITFNEKCVIRAEAQFDEESFQTICPDIYNHIGMRDWGQFTLPVDPYFPELVWELYASYRERKQLMKLEDRTKAFLRLTSVWVQGKEVKVTLEAINSLYWEEPISPHPILRKKKEDKANQFQWLAHIISQGQPQWAVSKGLIIEVPIEVVIFLACIMKHVHINVGEISADQFRLKVKQQATIFPFPSLVSMLCLRAECPLWLSFDKTIKVHGVITLDTKTNKEATMLKRARYLGNMTPPSPVASPHIATTPTNADTSQTSPPPDLLNIAQRAKMHENQFVQLAKAIPSMIQSALKKALQPAKDKLTHLCSKVDVIESEVTTLQ
ncbi:hypothetical protein HAX54_018533 [Datura stramonium]|uniref:Putative plant transposon protein domain-containing protein n=1 Tax=Datura stramonium TaxID=4076 RepID=A0ABS8UPN9_DATST|nr:hypothetical protein [Datura stramonium]